MLIAKVSLDLVMAVLLLMLYQKRTISMAFHEITGLALFGLFLLHILLNWRWVKAVTLKLFQKTADFRLRIGWIVNMLLFVSMTGIIITGLMIAKTLPINLGGWFGAKQWHYFLAAVSIVLMGIHLGLHWPFIKGVSLKISFLTKKPALMIGRIILIFSLAWGGYSLLTGSFAYWISGPFITSSFPMEGGMPEWTDEEMHDGSGNGGMGRGMGRGEGMGWGARNRMGNRGENGGDGTGMPPYGQGMNQSISILNILSVITTYGSEMIVFAFLTVIAFSRRKRAAADSTNPTPLPRTPEKESLP